MRYPFLDPMTELGLTREELPGHIAIIMDGNGRWARERRLPRIRGHQAGSRVVRDVVTRCAQFELEALTLYSFSVENWKRPKPEVDFLMELYVSYLIDERQEIMENNIRFMQIGRRQGLPERVLDQLDATVEASSANTGLKLILALNYGSRGEITDAVRELAADVKADRLRPEDITEQLISDSLYTAGMRDPDLVIRTAGESRISNFLLWQISYAEFFIENCYWPEFTTKHLDRAIIDYARRERRYGGLSAASSVP